MTVGADLKVHAWYDAEQDVIRMRIDGQLSSVNPDAESKRGNPHLFMKLGLALKAAGKGYPEIVDQ